MVTPKNSAGIIPVRQINGEWEYLLLKVYRYWDFPKGELDQDEDHWSCALRELREETGITQIEDVWGRTFIETSPYQRGKIARYYVARVSPDVEVKLSPEHYQWRWVKYAEAKTLLVERLQKVLDWAEAQMLAS